MAVLNAPIPSSQAQPLLHQVYVLHIPTLSCLLVRIIALSLATVIGRCCASRGLTIHLGLTQYVQHARRAFLPEAMSRLFVSQEMLFTLRAITLTFHPAEFAGLGSWKRSRATPVACRRRGWAQTRAADPARRVMPLATTYLLPVP